jgi:iron complex outermembrane receptor protein
MKKMLTLSLALSSALLASEIMIEKVTVASDREGTVTVKNSDLSRLKNPSDTASLIDMKAGVSMNTGGGFSSLPAIHGMADDRINTTVDGMQITSACPNHMNPALSYIDPSKVKNISVIAGIAPVSEGGDSIAGSISVKSKDPMFAAAANELLKDIAVSLFYRSNNHNQGLSASATVANDKISVNYSGFAEKAENYFAGNGAKVADTLYKQQNQKVSIAYKADAGVVKFTLGNQMIPYQGFANQYMDMNGNKSTFGNLSFDGKLGDVKLEANAFKKLTDHYMNKILSERTGNMPMYTAADELGYNIKASIPLSKEHILKIGSDFDKYKLNDWWPAAGGTMLGMNPNTFWNINDGHRDRLGIFAESNYQWSPKLVTNFGVRTDIVAMKTGTVSGYNDGTGAYSAAKNDPIDAAGFNAKDRKKTDNNYDVTASAQYEHNANSDFEFGFARKSRSPNIYERYSWAGGYGANPMMSGPLAMDMAMVNWNGDGNGYVGNIDLKPEIANTISMSVSLHDGSNKEWGVKITPYYTMVQDYIDADLLGTATMGGYAGIKLLRFANHDAVLFGTDFSANATVWNNGSFGKGVATAIASLTRGYRTDGTGSLYHMMPLNAKITLEHTMNAWTNGLYIQGVASKEQVNNIRKEPTTPGYALVDLKTNYKLSKYINFDFSVTNLFDKSYSLPLGGVNTIGTAKTSKISILGEGRSFNTAVNIKF